jgi:hypothetical protein
MGRGPESDEKKLAKLQAKLAADLGIDPALFEKHVEEVVDSPDDFVLEAETVLFYYSTKGQGFTHQVCPVCNRDFAYYYRAALGPGMMCSNTCRKKALEDLHIKWRPTKKPSDRYDLIQGEDEPLMRPATVPPEALAVLQKVIDPSA